MRTTAIFGPPGTGKTTKLVDVIGEHKDRTDMAVVSFSKASAQELTSRLVKDAMPAFIGTIHSFCFRELGLDRGQVVSDLWRFKAESGFLGEDVDQAVGIGQLAWRKNKKISEVYRGWTNLSVGYDFVISVFAAYNDWKKHHGLLDFDDMIRQAPGAVRKFETVIVDEAQDLSPIQWDVVESMVKDKGELVLAGDDDQAIYSWAGADPHAMRQLADVTSILGKSFRVPKAVHHYAQLTIKQIKNRQEKEYDPTEVMGTVDRYGHYPHLNFPHTVLCRDQYVMKEVEKDLIEMATPYRVIGPGGPGMFAGHAARIKHAAEDKDIEALHKLKRHMTTYGLATVELGEIPDWRLACRTDEETINYLERTETRLPVVVTVSTIHQQKGKEFDRGVIIAHCSPKVESMQETVMGFEDEVRVWYVALTRAKKGVTIVGTNNYIAF